MMLWTKLHSFGNSETKFLFFLRPLYENELQTSCVATLRNMEAILELGFLCELQYFIKTDRKSFLYSGFSSCESRSTTSSTV